MKVIFLQDVPRVGRRHEVKNVNDGYAMNLLLPKKLAVLATPKAIAELEARKKNIEIEKGIQDELLEKSLMAIKDKIVHLEAKADEKGHLFSGIHKKEIAAALEKEHRANIGEEFIMLEKPIKQVGEFDIPVAIGGKKSAFKLIVSQI